MAKVTKRSVAPIYAIALVWVIFTLVHPLYRVSDYVSVILLSALAFIVAKGIWPTAEYDLPDLAPEEIPQVETPQDQPEPAQEEEEEIPAKEAEEELPPTQEEPDEPQPDEDASSPDTKS